MGEEEVEVEVVPREELRYQDRGKVRLKQEVATCEDEAGRENPVEIR